MKIIFLDIDGVLNKQDFKVWFIEEKVQFLKEIVIKTGAKIVISSSWRYNKTVDDLKLKFKKFNLPQEIIDAVIDFTDIIHYNPPKGYSQRDKEIVAYIKDHKLENYIILDDWYWFPEEYLPRLVNTKTNIGLTRELTDKAINLLNNTGD